MDADTVLEAADRLNEATAAFSAFVALLADGSQLQADGLRQLLSPVEQNLREAARCMDLIRH